jgi:hypothetical protein
VAIAERLEAPSPDEGAGEPAPVGDAPQEETRQAALSDDRSWRHFAIACLSMLAITNGALAVFGFRDLASLKRNIGDSLWRSERQYQSIDAQIDFDSRRRRLVLGLRDEILATNASLDQARAYDYASLAVAAGERYPAADPALLVAIGIAGSGFQERAVSPSGALGLYQIYPSVARLVARSLGWEYTEDLLFDPARNTEIAAVYLETLFAVHGERSLVLTELRAGPLAPARERDPETERYLTSVERVRARIVSRYGTLLPGGDVAAQPAGSGEGDNGEARTGS